MKNYELIAKLMELPAGFDIELTVRVDRGALQDKDFILAGGKAKELEVCGESIELSC